MSDNETAKKDPLELLMWIGVFVVVVVVVLLVAASEGKIDRGIKETALGLASALIIIARYAWAISTTVLLVMILRRLPPKS